MGRNDETIVKGLRVLMDRDSSELEKEQAFDRIGERAQKNKDQIAENTKTLMPIKKAIAWVSGWFSAGGLGLAYIFWEELKPILRELVNTALK